MTCAPGPTAALTALALSGLPTGRFTFEGFLSVNRRARRDHLESLAGERRTMIFYEAPHKAPRHPDRSSRRVWGPADRAGPGTDQTARGDLDDHPLRRAVERYTAQTPRGEFVLILEGASPPVPASPDEEEAAALAARLMEEEGLSPSAAARRAAAETGVKKGDIYRRLTRESGGA